MNSAILLFGNAKSGLPGIGRCRRQPLIPERRNADARKSSVLLLRFDRIAAITSERFLLDKVSAIRLGSVLRRFEDGGVNPDQTPPPIDGNQVAMHPEASLLEAADDRPP